MKQRTDAVPIQLNPLDGSVPVPGVGCGCNACGAKPAAWAITVGMQDSGSVTTLRFCAECRRKLEKLLLGDRRIEFQPGEFDATVAALDACVQIAKPKQGETDGRIGLRGVTGWLPVPKKTRELIELAYKKLGRIVK